VRFLKFARAFNASFPGFETDIHGLVKQKRSDGNGGGNGSHIEYYLDCVRAVAAGDSHTGYAGFVERNVNRV
jgi:hypothetical protein